MKEFCMNFVPWNYNHLSAPAHEYIQELFNKHILYVYNTISKSLIPQRQEKNHINTSQKELIKTMKSPINSIKNKIKTNLITQKNRESVYRKELDKVLQEDIESILDLIYQKFEQKRFENDLIRLSIQRSLEKWLNIEKKSIYNDIYGFHRDYEEIEILWKEHYQIHSEDEFKRHWNFKEYIDHIKEEFEEELNNIHKEEQLYNVHPKMFEDVINIVIDYLKNVTYYRIKWCYNHLLANRNAFLTKICHAENQIKASETLFHILCSEDNIYPN